MDEITTWMRIAQNLTDRLVGSMSFRFILQPLMASTFAIIAGLRDARAGRPPYFWSLITGRAHRIDRLKDGWKSVGKAIVIALVLDVAYQIIILRFLYPGEAIIVAFVVVIVPYLILRGLVTRLATQK
jgi:hypothetical protein